MSSFRRGEDTEEGMVGQVFDRLTVLEKVPSDSDENMWRCRCICGKEVIRGSEYLLTRRQRYCGGKHPTPLKAEHPRLFRIWMDMKGRCDCDSSIQAFDYGFRGIRICDEWYDFSKFVEWSLDNGYSDGLSIDRIDNDGHYCPENCRWVTQKIQANNTRRTIYLEYKGKRQSIGMWAEELGVPYTTIYSRHVSGWSAERIFETPFKNHKK